MTGWTSRKNREDDDMELGAEELDEEIEFEEDDENEDFDDAEFDRRYGRLGNI